MEEDRKVCNICWKPYYSAAELEDHWKTEHPHPVWEKYKLMAASTVSSAVTVDSSKTTVKLTPSPKDQSLEDPKPEINGVSSRPSFKIEEPIPVIPEKNGNKVLERLVPYDSSEGSDEGDAEERANFDDDDQAQSSQTGNKFYATEERLEDFVGDEIGNHSSPLPPELDFEGHVYFKCKTPGCSKIYSSKSQYMDHVNRHIGFRPYICPSCPRSFYSSRKMDRHYKECGVKPGTVTETKEDESEGEMEPPPKLTLAASPTSPVEGEEELKVEMMPSPTEINKGLAEELAIHQNFVRIESTDEPSQDDDDDSEESDTATSPDDDSDEWNDLSEEEYDVPVPKRSSSRDAEIFTCLGCERSFSTKNGLSGHKQHCLKKTTSPGGTLRSGVEPDSEVVSNIKIPKVGIKKRRRRRRMWQEPGPSFPCSMCRKSFDDSGGLTHHIYSSHTEEQWPYNCLRCRRKFPTVKILSNHNYRFKVTGRCEQKWKWNRRPYGARVQVQGLTSSIANHTGGVPYVVTNESGVKWFSCPLCGKSFSNVLAVSGHKSTCIRRAKASKPVTSSEQSSSDEEDEVSLEQPGPSSSILNPTEQTGLNSNAEKYWNGNAKRFVCQLCQGGFVSDKKLSDHVRSEHPEEEWPFRCSKCKRRFCSAKSLGDHEYYARKNGRCAVMMHMWRKLKMRGVEPDSEVEPTSKVASQNQPFVTRKVGIKRWGTRGKYGTGTGPHFKCTMCKKRYTDAKSLSHHVHYNHSEEEWPHHCLRCRRGFPTAQALSNHNYVFKVKGWCEERAAWDHWTHRRRPFGARVQVQGLTSSTANHTRDNLSPYIVTIKSGVKRFSCPICGKSFRNVFAVSGHNGFCRRRSKSNDLVSPSKQSSTGDEDEVSLEQPGPSRPSMDPSEQIGSNSNAENYWNGSDKRFDCQLCEEGFVSDKKLGLHVRTQHPENEWPFCCSKCKRRFWSVKALGDHKYYARIIGRCARMKSTGTNIKRTNATPSSAVLPSDEEPSSTPALQDVSNYLTDHGNYKCPFCQMIVICEGNFRDHLNLHSGDRPYKCGYCSMGFYSNRRLCAHRDVCSRKDDISPEQQDSDPEFIHKSLRTLRKSQHSPGMYKKGIFKCETCGHVCTSPINLESHLRTHTGIKPFKCRVCPSSYYSSLSLQTHHGRSGHGKGHYSKATAAPTNPSQQINQIAQNELAPSEPAPSTSQAQYSAWMNRKGNFKCGTCGHVCVSRRNLENHKRMHSGIKPFKCSDCPSSYYSIEALQTHRRTTSGHGKGHYSKATEEATNPAQQINLMTAQPVASTSKDISIGLTCAICSKTLRTEMGLKSHTLLYHNRRLPGTSIQRKWQRGDQIFQCGFCSRKLKRFDTLQNHLRLHTGEKPYNCVDCGEAFISGASLWHHRPSCQGKEFGEMTTDTSSKDNNEDDDEEEVGPPVPSSFEESMSWEDVDDSKLDDEEEMAASQSNNTLNQGQIMTRKRKSISEDCSNRGPEPTIKKKRRTEFACPFSDCGKTLTSELNLSGHINMHNGVRPFGCPSCGLKYFSEKSLTNHYTTNVTRCVRRQTPSKPRWESGAKLQTPKQSTTTTPSTGYNYENEITTPTSSFAGSPRLELASTTTTPPPPRTICVPSSLTEDQICVFCEGNMKFVGNKEDLLEHMRAEHLS